MSRRTNSFEIELARRLLAFEESSGNANDPTAAIRVYEKLHRGFTTLLGEAGVHSLFMRSARLAQGEFRVLAAASVIGSSSGLRAWFQAQNHVSNDAIAAMFANFIGILITFVGERLTTQELRRAWPSLGETTLSEAKE